MESKENIEERNNQAGLQVYFAAVLNSIQSYLDHLNGIRWATWAIQAAIKKYILTIIVCKQTLFKHCLFPKKMD